jgi:ketosteroid isomerase-like protein
MSPIVEADEFRDAYRRFLDGDPGTLLALLDGDVVYRLPGRHLGGGVLRGREALLGRLAEAARWCDRVRVELQRVVAAGAFVVTIERVRFASGGRVLDQDACVVWRFVESRCAEVTTIFADQAACDAFWEGFADA